MNPSTDVARDEAHYDVASVCGIRQLFLRCCAFRCGTEVAETLQSHPDPPDSAAAAADGANGTPDPYGDDGEGGAVEVTATALIQWDGIMTALRPHRRWWERMHFHRG